jgi:hypothetical protein
MFKKQTPATLERLDKAIEDIFIDMGGFTSETEEYADMLKKLERLYKLKEQDTPQPFISPEVALTVAANLFGILAILHYEKVNVVTSKALSFVMKLK